MGDTNQPADPTEGIDEGSATGSTRRAYGFDWRHFTDWCEQADLSPLPPDPASIARYLTFCAEPIAGGSGGASVATVERRISGLIWNFAQRGATLSRQSAPIARALAHIRTTSNRPRDLKVPITGQDIIQMAGSLDRDLRGMRDRAILLLGLYGGLGRAEIVGLDIGSGDTEDGSGWIQWLDEKLILHVLGRRGHQRRVPIFSESSDHSCPVTALRTWLDFARIKRGAVFRRISLDGSHVLPDRLKGQHVARLVKRTAMAAGLRSDLPEGARRRLFSGHSLHAGTARVDDDRERLLYLRHAFPEIIREYRWSQSADYAARKGQPTSDGPAGTENRTRPGNRSTQV